MRYLSTNMRRLMASVFGFCGLPLAAGFLLSALPATVHAETKVTITKKDCQRVVRHQPAGDVAYKPGTGFRGRKVAPADLGGSFRMPLPDVFEWLNSRFVGIVVESLSIRFGSQRDGSRALSGLVLACR